ncbi:MAG: AMP-binding protein [Magnetococcales bacterium]|nr:AMP-binding protein [Magnetococcales bacterium]
MTVIKRFVTDLDRRSGSLFHIHDPETGAMVGYGCQEFYRWTMAWAERLRLGPDQVVLVFGRTTPMMMAAWLGAIVAGRLPAFLSYPSPKTSPEAFAEKLANYRNRFQSTMFVGELEDRQTWPDLLSPESLPSVDSFENRSDPEGAGDPPLFLQCSSGTTGLQKAVLIRESQLVAQIDRYRAALNLDAHTDRIVSWLPLYHDMGLVATFLLPLLTRTPVYYLDPFQWAATPGLLLATLERYRGTLTWLPNFAFSFLCKEKHRYRLDHVRGFINCSEPVSLGGFQRFMATHGVLPGQLSVCYALAENVFAASQSPMGHTPRWLSLDASALLRHQVVVQGGDRALDGASQPQAGQRAIISCGPPLSGVEVRIQPRAGADVGAIFLRGPCAVRGYYQAPAMDDDGWFPTGDLGFMHAGELYVCGRQKEVIIQNGKNIYPQDVEAILHSHPAVHPGRVAVVGMEDPELDTQRTFALVEPERAMTLDQRVLVGQELQSRLAWHLDIAVQVAVVPRGWLRKTSSGKMAREQNLQRYLTGLKDQVHVCGDSHVRIFWTGKTSHRNLFKAIHAHWVGLLWSDNWHKTTAFFSQLVAHLQPRDCLVIQAGEPECRSIFPASPDPEARIRQAVAGYRDFFLFLKKLWPGRLAYMTGIPTAPRDGDNGDPRWPVCGTATERYRYQQLFYGAMQALCAELLIHFIDACTPFLAADGMIAADDLLDGTHLIPSRVSVYVDLLEKNFGVINWEANDIPEDMRAWDGSYAHFAQLVQNKVRDHHPLVSNPSWERMVSSGLLDSLDIVELVTMLNQVCGLNIEPGGVYWKDFESIDGLYKKFVLGSNL